MCPVLRPAPLLAIMIVVAPLHAQDARIITCADEGADIPVAATVTDYEGPVPPQNTAGRAIPQMPGYPTSMGCQFNFKPTRGLVFSDLDGDGKLEVITSSTDSKIYAWDYAGNPMPGFPVSTIAWPQYAPSVADLDGDGDLEIVQLTRGQTNGGRLYVLDHLGNNLPGYPKSVNNNNLASCPTLYDLDDDGHLEIIVGERAYPLGYLHVFEPDGTEWGGNWPVALDHVPTGTAAVGDVDADGDPEIFYLSYNSMYLLELDGSNLPGWPQQIPNANFSYQSAALADLDGDGNLEIVVGAHKDAAGCYVFQHDGTAYPGWPKLVGTWTYCPPTVTDLEGDGELEILDGRAGYGPGMYSNCFWAWTSSGIVKSGFPYGQSQGGGSEGPLTVADINGDGLMEIFADHNITSADEGYLFGVDAAGDDLPGFPLRPLGFTYMNGATIGDVDGDGDYELGVVSNTDYVSYVNLYDLPDTYAATTRDWKVYHGRNSRGGLYPTCGYGLGDLNCDGRLDGFDIDPFVLVMSTEEPFDEYYALYPDCDHALADINGDGRIDGFDIGLFVDLLIAGE
ncbi:MAG: VCBS repeat-containing protein [Planctomycetes bacterium]|nr:VCBS repeat-containing protein [Planctomycetota bacterium]